MPGLVTNPAWAPAEPESLVIKERAQFLGLVLAWGAWGILFAVAIHCVKVLWRGARQSSNFRQRWFLLGYVFLITSLSTIGVILSTKWTQTFLIDQRNYPGGPMAYYAKFNANPIASTERVCDFMVNWMADGLLTYRVWVIYEGKLIALLPILTFLASFSMSVVELWIVTRPNASITQAKSVEFGLTYWSLSIAVNVMVTGLIVYRLFSARRRLAKALGSSGRQSGQLYTNVSAILVESAALYTIPGIIFLVGYSLGNPLSASVDALEVIQGIAPLLIILRVANGSAYSAATMTGLYTSSESGPSYRTGNMRFASGRTQPSAADSEQTEAEEVDPKDMELAVPVILMGSKHKGTQSSVQSIEPYPSFSAA